MSAEATSWVWKNSPYKANKMLVHLAIADVVNDAYTHRFFMTNTNLAAKCNTTRQTINVTLAEFVEDGYLEVLAQLGSGVVEYRFLFPEGVSDSDTPVSDSDRGVSANPTGGVSDSDTEQKTNPTEGTQGLTTTTSLFPDLTPEASQAEQRNAVWKTYLDAVMEFKRSRGDRLIEPKFNQPRKDLVDLRLRDGYTVEELQLAVTGWLHSDHHIGKNDQGIVYNDLELLLRVNKVEQFIRYHENKKPTRDKISESWGSDGEDLDAVYGVQVVDTRKDWDDD